eukprot:5634794-Amphidinium_carterae.1
MKKTIQESSEQLRVREVDQPSPRGLVPHYAGQEEDQRSIIQDDRLYIPKALGALSIPESQYGRSPPQINLHITGALLPHEEGRDNTARRPEPCVSDAQKERKPRRPLKRCREWGRHA